MRINNNNNNTIQYNTIKAFITCVHTVSRRVESEAQLANSDVTNSRSYSSISHPLILSYKV